MLEGEWDRQAARRHREKLRRQAESARLLALERAWLEHAQAIVVLRRGLLVALVTVAALAIALVVALVVA